MVEVHLLVVESKYNDDWINLSDMEYCKVQWLGPHQLAVRWQSSLKFYQPIIAKINFTPVNSTPGQLSHPQKHLYQIA